MNREIDKRRIETLYETRFLKCYDLQYAEGKHYFEASRRDKDDLVVGKTDDAFREMLPDAVTMFVRQTSSRIGFAHGTPSNSWGLGNSCTIQLSKWSNLTTLKRRPVCRALH